MSEPKAATGQPRLGWRWSSIMGLLIIVFLLGVWLGKSPRLEGWFERRLPFLDEWLLSLSVVVVLVSAFALHEWRRALQSGRERERLEAGLAAGEERYRQLFESNPQPMLVFDRETLAILEVNDAAVHQYGYSRQEFQALSVREIRPPADIPVLNAVLEQADAFDHTVAIRHRRKDGSVFETEVTSHALVFDGRPARAVMVTDVTERRQAELRLAETHALLQAIVRGSPLAIIVLDQSQRVKLWNRAAEDMFGYREQEVLGHPTPNIPADQVESFEELWQRSRRSESVITMEVTGERRDGRRIEVLLSTAPIFGVDGTFGGMVAVLADVTEKKNLEAQLQQAQRLEAIGRLAGGVAHDFNNLLTAINGHAQLLLDGLSADDPRRVDVVEIHRSGKRAATLTRQLLAFSRRQVLRPRIIDLNDVIANTETLLHRLIGEDVELMTELAPDLHAVRGDPTELEQVIMNLVVNARDALPHGGWIRVRTGNQTLEEELGHRLGFPIVPGPYVTLSVADNGCGMDAETLSHIFEPFFTTKDPATGTGLGLATVYGIIKQSGGYIWAESEVDQGTTFWICLPRHTAPATPLPVPQEVERTEGLTGRETLLLVEDEGSVRALTRRILTRQGYQVLEAASGTEALATAREHEGPIHLLITDLVMPRMSGRELAETLRPQRPEMKVLYMSGYTEDAVVRAGIRERGDPFIEKPFTPTDFAGKVRDTLDA